MNTAEGICWVYPEAWCSQLFINWLVLPQSLPANVTICSRYRTFKEVKLYKVTSMGPNPLGLENKVTTEISLTLHREMAMWGHSRRQPSASQRERPQEKPNLQRHWSWTSGLQNCERKFFSRLLQSLNLWYFVMAAHAKTPTYSFPDKRKTKGQNSIS